MHFNHSQSNNSSNSIKYVLQSTHSQVGTPEVHMSVFAYLLVLRNGLHLLSSENCQTHMNTSFHCFLSAVWSRIWCSTVEVPRVTSDKRTCSDHLNSTSDQQNGPAQNAEALPYGWKLERQVRSPPALIWPVFSCSFVRFASAFFYNFYLRTQAALENTEASNHLHVSSLF